MTARFCTFDVNGLVVGIDIERVEEVLLDQTVIPVPLAHPDVAGLLNLRGQIVTAVDARRRLGLPDRRLGTNPAFVVIRCGGELVSLLLDNAGDVVEVDEGCFEEVPETVSASIRAHTRCAYQLAESLLLVLDADRMLAVAS